MDGKEVAKLYDKLLYLSLATRITEKGLFSKKISTWWEIQPENISRDSSSEYIITIIHLYKRSVTDIAKMLVRIMRNFHVLIY